MSAAHLFTAGYADLVSVIPPRAPLVATTRIKKEDRGKAPGVKRRDGLWTGYPWRTKEKVTPRDIRQWTEWGSNIGLRGDNFPGLDIDSDSKVLTELVIQKAEAFLGGAPIRTSRGHRRLLVYATDRPFPRQSIDITLPSGTHTVELLGEGRQYVVFGQHPSGADYGWERGETLWDTPVDSLNKITAEDVQKLFEELRHTLADRADVKLSGARTTDPASPPPDQASLRAPSIEVLRDTLRAVPNDYPDRETYIQVGYATKAAAGSDPGGFDAWWDWASKWEGGTNDRETAVKDWQSFQPPFRIGWDYLRKLRGAAPIVAVHEFEVDPSEDPPEDHINVLVDARSDGDNADRFVQMHKGRVRYVPRWGRWLVWKENHWVVDHDAVHVSEMALDVGRELREKSRDMPAKEGAAVYSLGTRAMQAASIRNMLYLARGAEGVAVDYEDLDANPNLLGVRNGVIDLFTGELREAKPECLMTMQCPSLYDPNAEAPMWERAMREWFPDEEMRKYVQRLAGAGLFGAQKDHVFVIDYGHGANGKGTYTRVMDKVLGPYCVTAHPSLLSGSRTEHDTVRAHLFRARIAHASETKRRVTLKEESIKELTGGDRIQARRMREDPWEFDPSHMLRLQTNYLPEIQGRDEGIWRRIRVVEWSQQFDSKTRDPYLADKLALEGPGILRWMVEGGIEWHKSGLAEPEAVLEATLKYRNYEDKCSRMAEDCALRFGDGLSIRASRLQHTVQRWQQEMGVELSYPEVLTWLQDDKGCLRSRTSAGIQWQGVALPEEEEDQWEV